MGIDYKKTKKPVNMGTGHADNFQTPAGALDCLIPYLNKDWKIWEPACGKGNLVKGFMDKGFNVYGSDVLTGIDFLTTMAYCDCIVTNPPFSLKEEFLSRCYEIGNPFALLLPITSFDSKERRKLFHEHGVEVILPNGRISFETPNGKGSSSWFYSIWITYGLKLPKQLNFHGLD